MLAVQSERGLGIRCVHVLMGSQDVRVHIWQMEDVEMEEDETEEGA